MSRQDWVTLAIAVAGTIAGWFARHFGVDFTGRLVDKE